MGADAIGSEATPEQIAEMRAELGLALEAGALGFSFTQSSSHSDGDGQPVASRWATPDELVAMAEETGAHAGTTLEGIVQGCLDQFSDDEIELLGTMSAAADRPAQLERAHHRRARARPRAAPARRRRPRRRARRSPRRAHDAGRRPDEHELPHLLRDLAAAGVAARSWACRCPSASSACRDPDTRVWMLERSQSQEAGVFRRLADWGDYRLGDVYSEENEPLRGRVVGEIAARARQVELRHAARHRDRRRPAHRAVAGAEGRRRRVVGAAPQGVERPARADRRLRRRCPPRPHVRRALHHQVPRRLPPRPSARVARTRGAAHHERAGGAVRAARPRRAPRGRDRRRRRVRSRHRRLRGRHARRATCPATPLASPPAPSASCGCS